MHKSNTQLLEGETVRATEKIQQPKSRKHSYIAALLGTVLHSYDHSLYGFMAPLLVPLFLPDVEVATAFVLAYGLYPLKALFGPLGAFYVGRLGDRYGRKRALQFAMLGMALVTLTMGLLPTYAAVGLAAPILLALLRCLMSFFGAAEYNGGAVYCLEHSDYKHQGLMSGVYCAASVSGILLASVICTAVAYLPAAYWRVPFLLSCTTAWVSFYLRRHAEESPDYAASEFQHEPFWALTKRYKSEILSGLGVSAFFSALYMLPAVFFIAYIPMVTGLSTATAMSINTVTLLLYLMLLPVGGFLADRWGVRRSMGLATAATLIFAVPLFKLLQINTLTAVFLVKGLFSVLGAWFIGPFHTFLHRLFRPQERYTLASLCYSIGAKGGSAMPAAGILLWQYTQCVWAPAWLLVFWAILALFGIFGPKRA